MQSFGFENLFSPFPDQISCALCKQRSVCLSQFNQIAVKATMTLPSLQPDFTRDFIAMIHSGNELLTALSNRLVFWKSTLISALRALTLTYCHSHALTPLFISYIHNSAAILTGVLWSQVWSAWLYLYDHQRPITFSFPLSSSFGIHGLHWKYAKRLFTKTWCW